jgi:hypothetical protein
MTAAIESGRVIKQRYWRRATVGRSAHRISGVENNGRRCDHRRGNTQLHQLAGSHYAPKSWCDCGENVVGPWQVMLFFRFPKHVVGKQQRIGPGAAEAVAGCGRRLHRRPLSTVLAIGGGTCSNCGRLVPSAGLNLTKHCDAPVGPVRPSRVCDNDAVWAAAGQRGWFNAKRQTTVWFAPVNQLLTEGRRHRHPPGPGLPGVDPPAVSRVHDRAHRIDCDQLSRAA